MKKRRGFWIALGLFLLLGAWIRYIEPRLSRNDGKADPFLAVEPTRVAAITAGWVDTTRLEKREGSWFLASPVSFPADPYAVEALLSRTRNLEVRRRFQIEPNDVGRYGLDNPRAFIRLHLTDGTETTLLVGAPAPASPAFYVQVVGRNEVGLVSEGDIDNYFRKEVGGWRRQNLFVFPPAKLQAFELAAGGSRVTLVKREKDRWSVEAPFPGPADTKALEDFVKGLLAMKTRSFPDDAPRDLRRYGLSPPEGTVIVRLSGGGKDSLLIGSRFQGPTSMLRYARTSEFPNVFGVPEGYLDVAGRSHSFFRVKHLFQAPFQASSLLSMIKGPDSLVLVPDSTRAWRLKGERSTAGAPPPDRTDFARGWVNVAADTIVDAEGFRFVPAREGLRVALQSATGREMAEIGASIAVPGRGEMWPARLILSDPPRPREVFLLEPDLVRQMLALFQVRTAPPD